MSNRFQILCIKTADLLDQKSLIHIEGGGEEPSWGNVESIGRKGYLNFKKRGNGIYVIMNHYCPAILF